ncbi:GH3 auxin-responsive promoter family protein [Marivirga sp. S37H4]|uniref:GH3 auxin-responsive promoter family protein n=1 Tax=Marivirga aurantiaca TaxID=2802615 RepID=A0A935C9Y1_9BACT|nr:GH3 auxin-responsive promoter family protein [Marivirga aurantiaca]MBK6266441.1 GH3 auxin-responsive promoter family protein [Marivirga aurantiaca]
MEFLNSIMTWVMKKRIHEVELFMKYPHEVQSELLHRLVYRARNTKFGKKYQFEELKTYEAYKNRVPLFSYEQIFPYIDELLKGDQNILWPTEIRWFAKSSGTTNDRSKFIPVSDEALEDCHFKGGKDLLSIYLNNNPESRLFTGKNLSVGGSQQVNQFDNNSNSFYGDVSAVIMKNLPFWVQIIRTPSLEIALMDEWENKIEAMAQATLKEDVTSLSGVPTWTVVLLQRILDITGKSDISEVWPNLELFMHGAVSFVPYRPLFEDLIKSPKMNYVETYNASEGFFGIQDQLDSNEMLLMLDYGIFYEFIRLEDADKEQPETLRLHEVQLHEVYELVITTNAGLWRYRIGDTIRFTSLSPYRIKISGRTKHFINAFGEELMIENAEKAVAEVCKRMGVTVDNFTAAPKHLEHRKSGAHEWIIEFGKAPTDIEDFANQLDDEIRKINSDYDAKRQKDIALQRLIIHPVSKGTFYNWMRKRGKLGGQNKVPRLSNSREYLEDLLEMIK